MNATVDLRKRFFGFKSTHEKRFLSLTGFTFLELLVVIIIISVLSGILVPNLGKSFGNLQLDSAGRELQDIMNYCQQRSVVESSIIYFSLDQEKQVCRAYQKKPPRELKRYAFPKGIRLESDQKEILFYPDGSIDDVTLHVIGLDGRTMTFTTRGVFGGVKRVS